MGLQLPIVKNSITLSAEQSEIDEEVNNLQDHSDEKISEMAKKLMTTYFSTYEQPLEHNDPVETNTFKI